MTSNKWTTVELLAGPGMYYAGGPQALAEFTGRTPLACKQKAEKMGWKCRPYRPRSEVMEQIVVMGIESEMSAQTVARQVNRPADYCHALMKKMVRDGVLEMETSADMYTIFRLYRNAGRRPQEAPQGDCAPMGVR